MISLLWLIYILIDAVVNWYTIEKKKQVPDYLLMTIIRGMIAILFGAFALDLQQHKLWPFLGFTAGSFWLLFDPILNLMRGKSLFYVGTNAQLDKFGLKYPILYWGLKVAVTVLTIYSFVVLTK